MDFFAATGTHYHILGCSGIKSFWTQVHNLLQKVLDIPIPLKPMNFLLGLPFPGITKAARRLLAFILLSKHAIPVLVVYYTPLLLCNFLQPKLTYIG